MEDKMEDSHERHEKFHQDWKKFLQLKKQINTDYDRFKTTTFQEKADAEEIDNKDKEEEEKPDEKGEDDEDDNENDGPAEVESN